MSLICRSKPWAEQSSACESQFKQTTLMNLRLTLSLFRLTNSNRTQARTCKHNPVGLNNSAAYLHSTTPPVTKGLENVLSSDQVSINIWTDFIVVQNVSKNCSAQKNATMTFCILSRIFIGFAAIFSQVYAAAIKSPCI